MNIEDLIRLNVRSPILLETVVSIYNSPIRHRFASTEFIMISEPDTDTSSYRHFVQVTPITVPPHIFEEFSNWNRSFYAERPSDEDLILLRKFGRGLFLYDVFMHLLESEQEPHEILQEYQEVPDLSEYMRPDGIIQIPVNMSPGQWFMDNFTNQVPTPPDTPVVHQRNTNPFRRFDPRRPQGGRRR